MKLKELLEIIITAIVMVFAVIGLEDFFRMLAAA